MKFIVVTECQTRYRLGVEADSVDHAKEIVWASDLASIEFQSNPALDLLEEPTRSLNRIELVRPADEEHA